GPVAAVAPQPLAGAAWVHREGELLVVLGDLEGAGVRTDPARRMATPGRRQSLRDQLPVGGVDLLHALLPASLQAPLPGLADTLVPELLLEEGDQPGHPVDQHVVHELGLVLLPLTEVLGR